MSHLQIHPAISHSNIKHTVLCRSFQLKANRPFTKIALQNCSYSTGRKVKYLIWVVFRLNWLTAHSYSNISPRDCPGHAAPSYFENRFLKTRTFLRCVPVELTGWFFLHCILQYITGRLPSRWCIHRSLTGFSSWGIVPFWQNYKAGWARHLYFHFCLNLL